MSGRGRRQTGTTLPQSRGHARRDPKFCLNLANLCLQAAAVWKISTAWEVTVRPPCREDPAFLLVMCDDNASKISSLALSMLEAVVVISNFQERSIGYNH
jgi:hypothetical protein